MASINSKNSCIENFILIWLDKNIIETSDEYQNSIQLFQSFVNTIKLFSNPDEFRQFIRKIIDEKLFIIISGSFGENLFPELEILPQIFSIYIYCNQKKHHEKWAKNFEKVKGVYTDLQSISNAFRRDIRQANNDLILINILSPTINSNAFICSLLLKEILLNIKSNDQMKKDFIEYSRFYYNKNSIELNLIDQYEKQDSNQISSIQWYTRECFIYSMINRALRLYDIEILNKIAFFIQDLHKQIKDLHIKSHDYKQLTVYYGQGISYDQFEKLNMNINGLISFNSFLLTTIDKEVSLNYAKQSQNNRDLVSIFFQIEIDQSKSSFPFVSLDELDSYHDIDRYILFSLNSIFRIINIEYFEDKFWKINLILIDENEINDSIQKQIRKSKGYFSLGQIMFEMNNLNKSKNIFEILLQNTNDINQKERVSIHRMLGRINQKMENFESALSHYNESMKIQLSHLSSDNPLLSPTFASIGAIFEKLGNLNQALDHYKRAVDTSHQASKIDPYIIAYYYISIGRILYKQNKNLEARKNFELALKFEEKSHVPNDNYLAEIHHYLMIVS
jgi:hypothetical protein